MEDQPISGLGLLFYLIGGAAALLGLAVLMTGAGGMNTSDAISAFACIGSGLLFIAIGNALFHLRRIEHHLFKMREKEHLKDEAAKAASLSA